MIRNVKVRLSSSKSRSEQGDVIGYCCLLFLCAAFLGTEALARGDNLVANPGFEEGATGWTFFVPAESQGRNCHFDVVKDGAHSGAACARLTSDDFARFGIVSKGIAVVPGEHYHIVLWIRRAEDAQVKPGTPGLLVRLGLSQGRKDAPGGHLFITLGDRVARGAPPDPVGTLPSEWTKIEAVVEIPPDVDNLALAVFSYYAKGALFIDDISMEKVDPSIPATVLSQKVAAAAPGDHLPFSPPDISALLTPKKTHELFDALDLSSPEMKPVADAVAAGDYPQAEHLLAEYFRHRASPVWKFDSAPIKDHFADDAAKGRVKGGLVMPYHTFADNVFDWHYNETFVSPVAHNFEWQWQLCRMDFWINMANAYRATKDETYAQAWVKQLLYFIAECPPPYNVDLRAGSTWRTIDAGIRMMGSWPTAFFSFLPSPQVTDEDIALYLDSSLEHARYLKKNKSHGNWLTFEMSGLYTVGAYFPEFKEAADWRNDAAGCMRGEETSQFLPDGAHNELSTMYHNAALDNFLNIARVAKNVGRWNELPDGYISALEKAFDFNVYMMTPDRTLPQFNDSSSWKRSVVGRCRDALEFFPDRTDFQWIATDGKEGSPPAETSHAFPWAGFYVMRSGWEEDANYLVFRAGPLGAAHAHQDKLNVVLWAYGRQLLFNSGGGSYEQSKWRDYSVANFSKNTVLVDGQPQFRDTNNRDANISKAPIEARWESTADHDFAAGVYDQGYGTLTARLATHTRRVLFVKPDLFVIADTLVPSDAAEHTYQARWNLLTTQTQTDASTGQVTTVDKDQANMALVPLKPDNLTVLAVSGQTDPELLGWSVRKDMTPEAIPATTVTQTRKGSGPQSFLTLLVPIHPGAASPVKSVVPGAPESATVTFTDGRVFSITADPDPNGGIEVAETLPNGSPGRHVKVAAAAPQVSDSHNSTE
jgi:hypothetical protein